MKYLPICAVTLLLAGCGEGITITTSPAEDSSDTVKTTETTNTTNVETTETAVNEVNQPGAANEEEVAIENDDVTDEQTEEDVYTEEETDAFIVASTAIEQLVYWDSYRSVKASEHIVHTNPDNSYWYKETLQYVKAPHASHLIYESRNPEYMEIYANEEDGMFANDSATSPHWTYTMDADAIDMWQEEPLPDTHQLLQTIMEEHTKFTLNADNTVEFFVEMPSVTIDRLLFGGDSDYHMSTDVMLTLTIEDELTEYEIVSNYRTDDGDEGQFIVKETFSDVNALSDVRVPQQVKDQAISEEEDLDWNE